MSSMAKKASATKLEQKRLQEQAKIAMDLQGLQMRQYMVAGIQVQGTVIQTSLGPMQAAAVTFHMQDGTGHGPLILDPVGVINLIAGVSGAMANQPITPATGEAAPESPGATPGVTPDAIPEAEPLPSAIVERAAASGIVLP